MTCSDGNWFKAAFFILVCLLLLAGCGRHEPVETKAKGAKIMKIKSAAFSEGGLIPSRHSGEGEDVSPALSWSSVPEGTKELALICDDPDAPTPTAWVHWVIYKIPADSKGLAEGIQRQEKLTNPAGALQGTNSWTSDNIGYRGPMPPPGHGLHHYYFKLYALDTELAVEPGLNKDALLAAMKGRVLAEAQLIGTYQR